MIFDLITKAKELYYNNAKSGLKATNSQDAIDEVSGKVDQIAGNQIPEEYLEAAVDKYVNNNSGGFATKADIDNLIPPNYNYLLSKVEPINMIKITHLIANKYVDTQGIERDTDAFYVTPFIKVDGIESLWFVSCGLTCWYDVNYNFISYFQSAGTNYAISVPDNAYFVRSDIPVGSIDHAIISKVYPTQYDNGYLDFDKVYLQKKEYEEGFIDFTVPVNQDISGLVQNNTANALKDWESLVNVDCHIKLPTSYKPYGKPTKLIMLCHGAGRGITVENPNDNGTWKTSTEYNNLVNKFVDGGYAVFDCNGYNNTFAGCSFWGAHRGVEAWKKAYDYVVKNYNVETNFSIYGFSMGGLTAMHLVLNGFPNIKCVALGSPVLDLYKCWEDGQTVLMESAYGMSGYETEKVVGCDPIKHLVTILDKEYCLAKMPPIKIWYGSTEQGVCVNKEYAERMITAIKNSGYWGIYREVEGENHGICFGSNDKINTEYLYWINRFNNA